MKEILAVFSFLINLLFGTVKQDLIDPMRGYIEKSPKVENVKPEEIILITPTVKKVVKPTGVGYTGEWGKAQQIGEDTWTMRVGEDERMATPNEILEALNNYRIRSGSQKLSWDNKLAEYAQSRVEFFVKEGKTDAHAGFKNFLDNEDGYNKLGFDWLGENISYGFKLEGVHIIEWMYAGDKPHDDNQKNTRWDQVGIGVKGTATCLIFATSRR